MFHRDLLARRGGDPTVRYADASDYGFPDYSPGEARADNGIHVLGVTLALVGVTALFLSTPVAPGAAATLSLTAYAMGLVASFTASALYHLERPGRRKDLLRRIDHAAIFILIAGTYTPFLAVSIGGGRAMAILAAVWLIAALGIAGKLLLPRRREGRTVLLYLALGWAGLAGIDLMWTELPRFSFVMIGVGGILYSGGVVFHLAARLPYHNAIWHAMVLTASVCHYWAVYHAMFPTD